MASTKPGAIQVDDGSNRNVDVVTFALKLAQIRLQLTALGIQ
jgi:hypothetical protein